MVINDTFKIPKFKKLKSGQKRDLNYYLIEASKNRAYQLYTPEITYTSSTIDEWFWLWDTHGIKSNYYDIQLCGKIIQAKATLNLTISLWVKDILNPLDGWPILRPEEVWEYCYYYPSWVWKAFVGLLEKEALEQIEIIYRWQKIQYSPDGKVFWPAHYLDFDPSI